MRAYVGVTDNNWYRFLADRPGVTGVNFWQPSGAREFRVLDPGEPFFFKTHYPDNRVVGGGFFSRFTLYVWPGSVNSSSSLSSRARKVYRVVTIRCPVTSRSAELTRHRP